MILPFQYIALPPVEFLKNRFWNCDHILFVYFIKKYFGGCFKI